MMKFWKKGAMFGLDARIALAVLAIVSLSIGLSQEKEAQKSKLEETEFQLEFYEKHFMKYWEEVNLNGLFTKQYTDITTYTTIFKSTVKYNSGNNKQYMSMMGTSASGNWWQEYNYTNNENLQDYKLLSSYGENTNAPVDDFFYNGVFGYQNWNKEFYSNANSYFDDYTIRILTSQYLISLYKMREELGYKYVKTNLEMNKDTKDSLLIDRPLWGLGDDAYGNKIKMYYISEHNINEHTPLERIVHFVMYSYGENKTLDSILPKDLNELNSFVAQGDDVVRIFSDKSVYTKKKMESNSRLEEIKDRIKSVAENKYIDRISLCTTEVTPSVSCDLNSDGVFDNVDENMLLDLNPFPKQKQDSIATYLDSTDRFDNSTSTMQTTFLNYLGLPEYYAIDLNGGHLRYDSNIGSRSAGPYTMEVWY